MSFVVGTSVRIECDFEVDGVATEPTTVELKVQLPGESTGVVQSGLTTPQTGTRRKVYVPTLPGTYWAKWTTTGAAAGVAEKPFEVEASRVG
jgi:hypothetical protein